MSSRSKISIFPPIVGPYWVQVHQVVTGDIFWFFLRLISGFSQDCHYLNRIPWSIGPIWTIPIEGFLVPSETVVVVSSSASRSRTLRSGQWWPSFLDRDPSPEGGFSWPPPVRRYSRHIWTWISSDYLARWWFVSTRDYPSEGIWGYRGLWLDFLGCSLVCSVLEWGFGWPSPIVPGHSYKVGFVRFYRIAPYQSGVMQSSEPSTMS